MPGYTRRQYTHAREAFAVEREMAKHEHRMESLILNVETAELEDVKEKARRALEKYKSSIRVRLLVFSKKGSEIAGDALAKLRESAENGQVSMRGKVIYDLNLEECTLGVHGNPGKKLYHEKYAQETYIACKRIYLYI